MAATSKISGKGIALPKLTKTQIILGFGVIVVFLATLVSAASGVWSFVIIASIAFTILAAVIYLQGREATGKKSAPAKAAVESTASRERVIQVMSAIGAIILAIFVWNVAPPAGSVIVVLVVVTTAFIWWKKGNPVSYVRNDYKTIGHAASVMGDRVYTLLRAGIGHLLKLHFLPVRFELTGTKKQFFFGWVPFLMKEAGYVTPSIGIHKWWLKLSLHKFELVDLVALGYCAWSINDIRLLGLTAGGITLHYYVSAISQVMVILSLLVLLNKDGSQIRMFAYIVACGLGLYLDIGNTVIMALDKGPLNPDYIVLFNVDGSIIGLICGYAIAHELLVQPIWYLIRSKRPSEVTATFVGSVRGAATKVATANTAPVTEPATEAPREQAPMTEAVTGAPKEPVVITSPAMAQRIAETFPPDDEDDEVEAVDFGDWAPTQTIDTMQEGFNLKAIRSSINGYGGKSYDQIVELVHTVAKGLGRTDVLNLLKQIGEWIGQQKFVGDVEFTAAAIGRFR